MLNFFHSSAVDLEKLLSLWMKLVFKHFDGLVKLNGRHLLVVDGIKVGKEGKKMPGVKWLHQDSDSNSKTEFIMGHSIQAIAVLAKRCQSDCDQVNIWFVVGLPCHAKYYAIRLKLWTLK